MKLNSVISSLDRILEELNIIFLELNQRGSQFFDEEKYDQASQIIDQIKAVSAVQEKVLALREEWSGIDLPTVTQMTKKKNERSRKGPKNIESGLRTPNKAFHLPILRALVQLGGAGSVQAVLDRVHEMMKGQLNQYDYQSLPSNPKVIRWENNAQWARLVLVKEGYLASDSPRGVWEITEAGRERVRDAKVQTGTAEDPAEYHTAQFQFDPSKKILPFEVGQVYNRQKDLHDRYGGNRQSGISPCSEYPLIFLFTSPRGDEFGYEDGFLTEKDYRYTGEGQIGDMEMTRGNLAIRNHQEDGRALHVFKEASSGMYEYIDEFEYKDHEIVRGEDAEGNTRDVIRFVLRKV